jgi:hypothetical protein
MVNSIMAENRKTGHRQKLRERFLAEGHESCSDERLLELLLTFAIGRKDVRPLAQELVQIFGNLDHILSSRIKKPEEKKTPSAKKSVRRKFQISRSHLFEFNHFSRILSFLYENRSTKRISRDLLIENSGLPDGQVASLISIGAAMDIIQTRSQTLTPTGLIIAEHDIFLEGQGTLEWCHYKGAGSYKNFLWFEVFNHILAEEPAMTQAGLQKYFKKKLKGRYSDKTINDHVPKEIRFIVDAYTKRNFNKLEILHMSADDQLYRRRYTKFAPLVLNAMIYDFCATKETHLFQIGEMAVTPGSPAVVFGLDAALFRQQIEGLHDRGWLRYETTHNLDQIRLKPGFSALEFLTAHFEDRDPREDTKPLPGGIFQ